MPRTETRPLGRSLAFALAAALALRVLPACAGGGSGAGDGPALNVHLATSQLTARLFHGQAHLTNTNSPLVSVQVSGTVDPVPQGNLYVRIVLDAPVFEPSVGLQVTPPNGFTLYFTPVTDLPAGVHSGIITMQVFQDAAMTQPYRVTGGTLPYAVTVDPQLTVSVRIDGVLQAEVFTSSHHAVTQINPIGYGTIYWREATPPAPTWTLHPGQVVELEANVPVTWYGPDRTGGPYGFWFAEPTVTATTITQTMPDPAAHQAAGLAGSSFIAMPADGSAQYGAGFVFDLTP